MSDILIVLQMIVVVICLDVIVTLCFKKQCAERGTLLLIMTAVFGYNLVGTLAGTMTRNYLHNVSDILYMIAEICFFLGMWKLIGYMINRPWPKWIMNMVTVYFSVLLAARLTDEWHDLFYKERVIVELADTTDIQIESGIFMYLYMVGIMLNSLAMFLVCLTVCIRKHGKTGQNEWKKYHLMTFATIFPLVNVSIYFAGTNYYEMEPFGMFAEGMLMIVAVNKYHFQQVVESARELVVETMDIGLLIADKESGYLDSNACATQIFPELNGMEKGENLGNVIPEIWKNFQGEMTGEVEKNGKYYAWKKSQVYLQKRQRGYAICIYDITEQKRAMGRLLEMKQNAEAESKQKSNFLANASHEIRTPMNVIMGMSEVCIQKTENTEMKDTLRIIKEASESLLETINGILDFSKIEAGKAELQADVYSLEKMLLDFYKIMQGRLYQKNVEFKIKIGEGVPKFLVGDGGKVRTVLSNLLGNAGKYTREGTIMLRVERVEEAGSPWILFAVSDTGIGMAEQDINRIFEKYTQVGDETEIHRRGSGLGLSIVGDLVEVMEGTVQVETSLGEGSVFRVKLPMVRMGEEYFDNAEVNQKWLEQYQNKEKETENISVIYPKGRILVVDDMEVNLKVAQGMLELYQIEVHGVLSGKMALETLEKNTYDILMIDQMMPQMDGVETLKQIRALGIQTPAVAVTAQNIQEEIRYLKESGFDNVLVKPVERRKLEQILDFYMHSKKQKGSVRKNTNQQDILKSYYYQVSEIAKELSQQYQEDVKTFLIQVHGIKGASRNIGAVLAGNLAERLEQEGKAGNFSYVEEHMEEFQGVLRETLRWVKKKIKETHVEKPGKEKIEEKQMEYIAEQLEEFELENAREELEKIMQYSYSAPEEEMLFQLESMMVNLEYEEAVNVIQKFLSQKSQM